MRARVVQVLSSATARARRAARVASSGVVVLAAALGVALALGAPSPAAAGVGAPGAPGGFVLAPTQDAPGMFTVSQLTATSCTSATFCMAVGSSSPDFVTSSPLVEQWDGRSWTIVASPDGGNPVAVLDAVSCTSPTFCLAGGYSQDASGDNVVPFFLAWDGQRWQVVAGGAVPGAETPASVAGVSCASPGFCVAVGQATSPDTGATVGFAEVDEAGTWSLADLPGSAGATTLNAVSCPSPAACTAVGETETGAAVPYALEWTAGTWTTTASGPIGGLADLVLDGVSCLGPDACMAVGDFTDTVDGQGYRHAAGAFFDGTAWGALADPEADPALDAAFTSVSCVAGSGCLAAGEQQVGGNYETALALWAGRSWGAVPSPNADPTQSNELDAVSCADGACQAVGGYGDSIDPTMAVTGPAPTQGYWLVARDGGLFSYGAAGFEGSMGGRPLNQPIVAVAPTADGKGYWEVAADGGIFCFGDATYHGSLPALGVPADDIVGIVPTADGGGYWMVGADGGVFGFGDAGYVGSLPSIGVSVHNIVGIVPTADGGGYWMVGADGGVFGLGDATYVGSLPALGVSVGDVVAIAPSPTGQGYWMVGADGAVYALGDARYFGSMGGSALVAPVVALSPSPDGQGYWMMAADGGVFAFGSATMLGSMGGHPLNQPIVGASAI